MMTVDAEAAPEAAEELPAEEYELIASLDESDAQERRCWRATEFRRHRRIDRAGNVVAAVLGVLLLYAAAHGRFGH